MIGGPIYLGHIGLESHHFFQLGHLSYGMKHTISMRWLANPYWMISHLPHNFHRSYYQREDSYAPYMIKEVPPNYVNYQA